MVDNTKTKEEIAIKSLKFSNSWNQLTKFEKNYAYNFFKASWEGYPIILFQLSPQGPLLFALFQKFFQSFPDLNELKKDIEDKFSKEISDSFFEYAATVYDNAGNYRSFGYDKIYCEVPKETFEKIIRLSCCPQTIKIFEEIGDIIYDKSELTKTINLTEKGGVNAYYLGGIKEEEIKKVDSFLSSINISHLNTRLIKFKNNDDIECLAYLVGSVDNKVIDHGNNIYGVQGDFDVFLANLNKYLAKCKDFTEREFQLKMIDKYLESFNSGSVEAHKESQIFWVKDIKPVVETNIGWIETYIDPMGIRAYYEGFVALVDKENTKKFTTLVNNAASLLSPNNIPWSYHFENYPFREPDYTQIDVICFASDDCPLGINIPNYDDITEKYGFKNVTIGNNQVTFKADKIKFIKKEDAKILEQHGTIADSIHTACHELLGHGSGKLLRQNEDGSFNFKKGEVFDPFSNKEVTYYNKDETFETKFTDICRSYEECRADISGIYFGSMPNVHKIFNVKEEDGDNIIYCLWTNQLRRGFVGSKFFNPGTNKWGQAHVQGAYVFTQFVLRNQNKENPIVSVSFNEDETDFTINVSKSAIIEYGTELLTKMLVKLNVWKSTGNEKDGREFYSSHSQVDEFISKVRDIVIKKLPKRSLTINNNLNVNSETGDIEVKEYEESCLGLIQSYVDRYDDATSNNIISQYRKWDEIRSIIQKQKKVFKNMKDNNFKIKYY